jgi:hypothetical protein
MVTLASKESVGTVGDSSRGMESSRGSRTTEEVVPTAQVETGRVVETTNPGLPGHRMHATSVDSADIGPTSVVHPTSTANCFSNPSLNHLSPTVENKKGTPRQTGRSRS